MGGEAIQLLGAFAAALVAGAINSVAGGGSMISFPALVALGLPPVVANATNTVGIWPGSVGSLWGFRGEWGRVERPMLWLLVPGVVGGIVGAILLRCTPEGMFDRLVPWLILMATVLFMVQGVVQKKLKSVEAAGRRRKRWWFAAIMVQLGVSIYGGYFGAGMSIMMLSVLGLLGMTDILEMSAMTSLLSLSINGVAGVLFIVLGLVSWPHAVVMAMGAVVGGYGATGAARRVGKVAIRRFVVVMGVGITVAMYWRVLRG